MNHNKQNLKSGDTVLLDSDKGNRSTVVIVHITETGMFSRVHSAHVENPTDADCWDVMTVRLKKMNKTHDHKKKFERLAVYPTQFIFDFAAANPDATHYVDESGNKCKLRRVRIFLEKGVNCVGKRCNNNGQYFALEKHSDGQMHFDLFGVDADGDEVLMTANRIIVGKELPVDYMPLCYCCNQVKLDLIRAKAELA